jgi:hypothetical protein
LEEEERGITSAAHRQGSHKWVSIRSLNNFIWLLLTSDISV